MLKGNRRANESQMAVYRVHFVDHGDNIYHTDYVEHEHDEAAIEAARRIDVPAIGAGFDLWQGDRLVYRHRR